MINNINQFNTVTFVDENNHSVPETYEGRKYRVVTETTLFSKEERLFRGMLAICALVASVGLILIFKANQIKQLLTLKEKSSKEIERTLIEPLVPPTINQKAPDEQPVSNDNTIEIKSEIPVVTKEEILDVSKGEIPVVTKEEIPVKKEEKKKGMVHPLPTPPDGVIKNGYGEYLVYRMSHEGKRIAVSEKEYIEIFDIIEKTRTQVPNNRHAYLEEKIQEKLGKEVQIAFIPRTLYEQIFLHECILEEMDKRNSLNAREVGAHAVLETTIEEKEEPKENKGERYGLEMSSNDRKEYIKRGMQRAFWQLCIYKDQDYEQGFKKRHEDDYRQEHLVKVASKLNEVALAKFNGKIFTFAEIVDVQNQEIDFFKSLKDPQSENYAKTKIRFLTYPSLAQRFRDEQHPIRSHELYPLGIEKETGRGTQIVQKAVQLECTAEAVNHLLLYRGAKFDQDEMMRKDDLANSLSDEKELANSLSFGTSLYGGALYDGGATAIHYMRKITDAQVFMIPLEKQLKNETPFHAYFVHPLVSLGSMGEIFHARTKIWKLPDNAEVLGFLGLAKYKFSQIKECCKTDQTKENLKTSFAEYKSKAYILVPRFN